LVPRSGEQGPTTAEAIGPRSGTSRAPTGFAPPLMAVAACGGDFCGIVCTGGTAGQSCRHASSAPGSAAPW
jgi:hypothetical protein